jgi:hypothetical protein
MRKKWRQSKIFGLTKKIKELKESTKKVLYSIWKNDYSKQILHKESKIPSNFPLDKPTIGVIVDYGVRKIIADLKGFKFYDERSELFSISNPQQKIFYQNVQSATHWTACFYDILNISNNHFMYFNERIVNFKRKLTKEIQFFRKLFTRIEKGLEIYLKEQTAYVDLNFHFTHRKCKGDCDLLINHNRIIDIKCYTFEDHLLKYYGNEDKDKTEFEIPYCLLQLYGYAALAWAQGINIKTISIYNPLKGTLLDMDIQNWKDQKFFLTLLGIIPQRLNKSTSSKPFSIYRSNSFRRKPTLLTRKINRIRTRLNSSYNKIKSIN